MSEYGHLLANQAAFLVALPACRNNITAAAEAAGVHRCQHYVWLKENPEYAKAYASAREVAIDALESSAWASAVDGERKLVLHEGQPVFVDIDENGEVCEPERSVKKVPLYETRRSDTLRIFLLKGARPKCTASDRT